MGPVSDPLWKQFVREPHKGSHFHEHGGFREINAEGPDVTLLMQKQACGTVKTREPLSQGRMIALVQRGFVVVAETPYGATNPQTEKTLLCICPVRASYLGG